MRFILALTAALLLNATAWPQDFQRFSPSGVGPLIIKSEIEKFGKGVRIHVTATNGSGVPIRYVRLCIRDLKARAGDCAGVLGWDDLWQPEAAIHLDANLRRPVKPGAYDIQPGILIPADKIDLVRRVYVEPLDGNDKDMVREQLMAAIVITRRFELAAGAESADATLAGRAETWVAGSASSTSGQTTTAGSILRLPVAAVGGAVANGRSEGSTKTIFDKAVVLRLTRAGESIWAWDDSKDCTAQAKAKCAVDDLMQFAAHPPVPAMR